jgi:hypothetical protein
MLRKHEGRSSAQSIPKDAHDFTADTQAITNATGGAINLVRTYAASGSPSTAQAVLQAANATGIQVLLGTWSSISEQ